MNRWNYGSECPRPAYYSVVMYPSWIFGSETDPSWTFIEPSQAGRYLKRAEYEQDLFAKQADYDIHFAQKSLVLGLSNHKASY